MGQNIRKSFVTRGIFIYQENNRVERTFGQFSPRTESTKSHHELLYMIDGYDPDRGVNVAGHRGYFLKVFFFSFFSCI